MKRFVIFLLFELTIRWIYDALKKRKAKNEAEEPCTCSKTKNRTLVQAKGVAESGLANKKRSNKKARFKGRAHA